MQRQRFVTKSYNPLTRNGLFDQLLDSLNLTFGRNESYEHAWFEEWKKNGPTWEKELTVQSLIIRGWLNDHIGFVRDIRGMVREPTSLSKIYDEVLTHFKSHPPEETGDGGRVRTIVIAELERAISSCLDLSEATRGDLLKYLKEPSHAYESLFRKTVGLLLGGEDDKGI